MAALHFGRDSYQINGEKEREGERYTLALVTGLAAG